MDDLFDTITAFNQPVFRNIVYLDHPETVFDDLIPSQTVLESGRKIAFDTVARQRFHENTAIWYPFDKKNAEPTRYGDGKFGVWYGSIERHTSIYETVFHMFQQMGTFEHKTEIIMRKRAIYTVHTKAILIDLRSKKHPELISNHYRFTQAIGTRLHQEGHPGLLTRSARCDGNNVVIFNKRVLSTPNRLETLIYQYDPTDQSIFVHALKSNEGIRILRSDYIFS